MPRKLLYMKGYRKPQLGGGNRLRLSKPTGLMNSIRRYNVVYRGPGHPANNIDVYSQETSTGHDATVGTGKPEETQPSHFNLQPGQSLRGRGEGNDEESDMKLIDERLDHPEISTGLLYDSDEEQATEEPTKKEQTAATNKTKTEQNVAQQKQSGSGTVQVEQSGSGRVQHGQSALGGSGGDSGSSISAKGKGRGKSSGGKKNIKMDASVMDFKFD